MADSEKIDAMFGMLHELKPVVLAIKEDTKSMDARLRASEVQGAEHGVKIDRLQDDVDGLGRKVRVVETRAANPLPDKTPRESGKWTATIEFLAALPAYWHFIGAAMAGAVAAAALLIRHGL